MIYYQSAQHVKRAKEMLMHAISVENHHAGCTQLVQALILCGPKLNTHEYNLVGSWLVNNGAYDFVIEHMAPSDAANIAQSMLQVTNSQAVYPI